MVLWETHTPQTSHPEFDSQPQLQLGNSGNCLLMSDDLLPSRQLLNFICKMYDVNFKSISTGRNCLRPFPQLPNYIFKMSDVNFISLSTSMYCLFPSPQLPN